MYLSKKLKEKYFIKYSAGQFSRVPSQVVLPYKNRPALFNIAHIYSLDLGLYAHEASTHFAKAYRDQLYNCED